MRTLTPLLVGAACFLALALCTAAAAEDIPSLRDRPVTVECYQEGQKIVTGDATDFEGVGGADLINFLFEGRALQIRAVGSAVCVISAKEAGGEK